MNIRVTALVLAIFAVCGIGCSPDAKAPEGGEKASESPSAQVAQAPGTPEAPREVRIEATDAMKFSVARLEAAAGETLRVLLVNVGSAPKEAMGHNWVLLKAGVDVADYAKTAAVARGDDYVPPARAEDVIVHTKLLGGGGKDAVVFTVPADATSGTELPFLCTFPAHFQLGMKGVLVVR